MSPFAQRLEREAERRGCGLADVRFALGDGEAWIWFAVEELFPGANQILDACHAAEKLFDAAKAVGGRGEMAEALARRCAVESNTFDNVREYWSEQKKAA